jgi:L-rhamnose-H+ transport protein
LACCFIGLGGLSSASFYVPYQAASSAWSWEIFWLTGGIFSWLIAPWLLASIQTHDLLGVLARHPAAHALLVLVLGRDAWGFGGLTFGLTMRYLGLSLGMAVALGPDHGDRHDGPADLPRHAGGACGRDAERAR